MNTKFFFFKNNFLFGEKFVRSTRDYKIHFENLSQFKKYYRVKMLKLFCLFPLLRKKKYTSKRNLRNQPNHIIKLCRSFKIYTYILHKCMGECGSKTSKWYRNEKIAFNIDRFFLFYSILFFSRAYFKKKSLAKKRSISPINKNL